MRFQPLRETPEKYGSDGNKRCRNCELPVASGRRHYCSEECMNKYIRDNTWFWVRKDVLKRDKYKCSICNTKLKKSHLDVDHIIPIRMGGQLYDKLNLRTLCKECHKAKSKLDKEALGY